MDEKKVYAEFTMEFELTHEAIVGILADGLWQGYCGFDDVDYNEGEFAEARQALVDEGWPRDEICVEDVEARMLFMGKEIRLHMCEESPNSHWYGLTLPKLVEGIKKYAQNDHNGDIYDVLLGDPQCKLDSTDMDAILQYACFGEIVIG